MDTYETLNGVLVNLFRDVMNLEENAIITSEYSDITNNDMHVIEAVGLGEPRIVNISLSEKGKCAYRHHEEFHRHMIDEILKDLTEEETEALVRSLSKLEQWFRRFQED